MGTLNFLGSVGYLKNNPCNIRYSKNVIWEGEDGSVLGYSIFKNMMYGYKAAIELVNIYIKKGYSTLEDITSRWSSVFENDRKAYVSRLDISMPYPPLSFPPYQAQGHPQLLDRKARL